MIRRQTSASATTESGCRHGSEDIDPELLHAAIADPAAFEPVYRHYAPAIYRFCYRRLGHADNAADATSQTFIKALAGLQNFRPGPDNPGKTFRAWLYRIAANVVVDQHRRYRPHRSIDATGNDTGQAMNVPDPARSPEDLAISRDDSRAVRAAIEHLPDRHRQIVELRLAGLSGDEIAEAMGTSLSAVKSAQFRAYATLRRVLQPFVNEPEGPSR